MSGQFARIEQHLTDQGQSVAYKIYSKSHGQLVYKHYARELWAFEVLSIKTLEESRKNHVVFLMDQVESPAHYKLVFPFYNKTLADLLFDGKELAVRFMQDIGKGLTYLHERDIIHCDLSPSNILIDKDGTMLISDFGCAQKKGYAESEVVGTCFYLAPEHLFNYKWYSPSTDIWSLGVIFAVLLTSVQIFDGENHILQLGKMKFRMGNPSKEVKKELAVYPDFKKLTFFDEEDDDYDIEYDSIEEYEEMMAIRKPLKDILQEHNVSAEYQEIILGILTWSIKERLTLPEILKRLPP